ncbi:MAG: carboxypeptidase regulatory-like domain-containing protein [Acidobacteriota bacterium]|nr:carboxypeptidase regulatory-like domain-containing protein [Acidobacteriota bacterium]
MKLFPAVRQFASVIALVGALASAGFLSGADLSLPITGDLLGTVVDSEGSAQIGASVQIFDKYRRILAHTLTTSEGRFAFAELPANTYSVRVIATSFLPASCDQISVKPGVESVLRIHLATLLSSIEVSYKVPTGAMSEDWKWVLRSSPATRPVNRILSDESDTEAQVRPRVFSGTHAVLALSGGENGGLVDQDEVGSDLGTAFAISTNLLEKNQLQFAGIYGQNSMAAPAAIALCAIYSRNDTGLLAAPPEVTFTMAQIGGVGSQLSGEASNVTRGGFPALRTMAMSIYETADPLDTIHIEYGATSESVDLLQHASRISPFGRVTVDLGPGGEIIAAYSDGGRPDELMAHQQAHETELGDRSTELSSPLDNLSRLPQLSERNGRLELQRTQNYEIGYKKSLGSRIYSVSAFSEHVSNGRLNVSGDLDNLNPEDLFSDGISALSTYNVGRYDRKGYLASLDQHVSDSLELGLAYGRLGGFTPGGAAFDSGLYSAAAFLGEKNHNIASLSMKGTVPRAGTHISTNYGWIDRGAILPRHSFTTQDVVATPGFNILIRQPLPSLFGLSGRFELTADLRNLLAQGYVPVAMPGGRQLLAVEAPRAIRGGLKFIF